MSVSEKEKKIWESKYIGRLIQRGLSRELAEDVLKSSDEIDYSDDPAWSADEELSYWSD